MTKLLHFVASWAQSTCVPHRIEVASAAARLGLEYSEVDVDVEGELAMTYSVLNVPAVAIEGHVDSRVMGAKSCEKLVHDLRPFCD